MQILTALLSAADLKHSVRLVNTEIYVVLWSWLVQYFCAVETLWESVVVKSALMFRVQIAFLGDLFVSSCRVSSAVQPKRCLQNTLLLVCHVADLS